MDRVDKPRCVLDFEKHNKIKIKDFTGYGNHLDPLKRAFSMALLGAEDHFKLDDKGNVISLSLTSYFGVERIRLDMFPTLRSLSIISYTNLSKIEGLDQLKKLKMLDLSDTKLKEIKGLDQLKSLTTLNLSNTEISEIKGLDQLKSLTTLNLSNTKISEIKGLDQLGSLTTLNLSNTEISEIKGLDQLGSLTTLNLSNTEISEIKGLDQLKSLTALNLSNTEISEIKGLDQLKSLTTLNLSNTKISEIKGLDQLKSLTTLNLSNTEISEIKGLDQLKSLTTLNLSNTKISEIKGLDQLKYLTLLDLSGTSLSEIKSLDQLENLITLKLSNTNILEIRGLNQLKNLIALDLSYTKLKEIKGLDRLKKLETLNLSDTEITELKGLCKLRRLKTLFLSNANIERLESLHRATIEQLENFRIDGNPFLIFEDIILPGNRNHKEDILNIFEERGEEHKPFEYPYKVMLLGNHGSGKSSFLARFDKKYIQSGSTHILEIFESRKRGCPKINFYDFGGQDYYHGIYQAFITNETLNMLFFEERSDHNQRARDCYGVDIINFNREYWLSQIDYSCLRKQAHSKEIIEKDTFVVQTHADMSLKPKTLGGNRSSVIQELFVNLFDNYDIKYLASKLTEAIMIRNKKKEYPKSQIALYREIQKLRNTVGHNYVKIDQLLKGYTRSILKAKLYKLYCRGDVLYYRDDSQLEDVVWVNPSETVKYIHSILAKDEVIVNEGKISENDMLSFFEQDKFLLKLLINENTVFHDCRNKVYVIPSYLPLAKKDDKKYKWKISEFGAPNFSLKFETFIPFGLMNQLICYYGQDKNELNEYWRDQLFFTLRDKYKLWIELDFERLIINVYIKSLNSNLEGDITTVGREVFDDIFCLYWGEKPLRQKTSEHLQYYTEIDYKLITLEPSLREEYMHLLQQERLANPISDLYISIPNYQGNEKEQFYVHLETLDDSNRTSDNILGYPLKSDGLINRSKGKSISTRMYRNFSINPNLGKPKKIFISYSKADREDLMELNKFLEDLKREEKIEVYYDERTTPGDMIHEVISQKIIEADYVIALVSQDYLSTKYIREKELPQIEKKGRRFIPIILKPCCWMETNISKRYAVLKGKEIYPILKDIHPEQYKAYKAKNWVDAVDEIRKKLLENKDN